MLVPGNPRFERFRERGTDFDLNLPPRDRARVHERNDGARARRAHRTVHARPRHRSAQKSLEMEAMAARCGFTLAARMRAFDAAITPEKHRRNRDAAAHDAAQRSHRVKKVVSVSLGSSTRDHRAERESAWAKSSKSRASAPTESSTSRSPRCASSTGTSMRSAWAASTSICTPGKHRYALRDGLRLLEAAKITPVVDGSGLRTRSNARRCASCSDDLGDRICGASTC